MKNFFFLCGLPRSGSTLLASILSQNPLVYTSPNSPLVELLVNVSNHLDTTEQARAFLHPTQKHDVLHGLFENFYRCIEKPIIVDKSRAWPHPHNIELLKRTLESTPKFIATVRDLPSTLASFIVKIEAHPEHESYIDILLKKQGVTPTTETRVEYLFSPGGTVFEAWYSLKEAFDAGHSDLFHLIEYDDLTSHPEHTLRDLYRFLDLPLYSHDLAHIENKTPENDAVYNIPDLHAVRPVLKKTSHDPRAVLGPRLYQKYANVPHFWRTSAQVALPTAPGKKNPFDIHLFKRTQV